MSSYGSMSESCEDDLLDTAIETGGVHTRHEDICLV